MSSRMVAVSADAQAAARWGCESLAPVTSQSERRGVGGGCSDLARHAGGGTTRISGRNPRDSGTMRILGSIVGSAGIKIMPQRTAGLRSGTGGNVIGGWGSRGWGCVASGLGGRGDDRLCTACGVREGLSSLSGRSAACPVAHAVGVLAEFTATTSASIPGATFTAHLSKLRRRGRRFSRCPRSDRKSGLKHEAGPADTVSSL
jgi:hypothetical protein